MYFVDFLGKVLLPLFYCPIFFTIAYENFFRGGVNRIGSDHEQKEWVKMPAHFLKTLVTLWVISKIFQNHLIQPPKLTRLDPILI
jgi:hypothetical protein